MKRKPRNRPSRRTRTRDRKEVKRSLTLESLETRCLLSTTPAVEAIREASGVDASAIQATVDTFRQDLGDPLNGANVGSQGAGRRQIDWDAVPDADSAPSRFPADFLNAVSPRGAVFGMNDPIVQFAVSADASNPSSTPVEFGDINNTYSTAFSTFSSERLFAPLTTNVMEIDFRLPGAVDRARVSGFGAVFTDVDTAGGTRIEYFGTDGVKIFSRDVLASPGDGGLSFLGVKFAGAPVGKVRITLGDGQLGPNDVTQGGTTDVVALDDFIYGEPQPLTSRVVVGAGLQAAPRVRVFDGDTGKLEANFLAYGRAFRGGVHVATGDVTGDGVDDIVTGHGPGRKSLVRVFDGVNFKMVNQFLAFPGRFRGGVQVAVANMNGDANMDIVVGRGPGPAPAGTRQVRVLNGAALSTEINSFNAFSSTFQGGVFVAAGDVNGDFVDEVIVSHASQGSRVRVFDAVNQNLLRQLQPFGRRFRGGAFVAADDVNGDGIQDIVVGQGSDGQKSQGLIRTFDKATGKQLRQHIPFSNFNGGVRVSTADVNRDGKTDIIAGAGEGRKSLVRVLGVSTADLDSFFAFNPGFTGGIFVAGLDD